MKCLHEMEPSQIPTTTQSPKNIPSTRNVEALEDIGILRDAQALGIEEMINL